MLSAFTMNNVNEAIGITRAAAATARPFVLSFTVETDGRLPTGDPLGAAIEVVDAATEGYPAYRSEEHTSELQSLMRISYAVFCLKKKKSQNTHTIKSIEH